MTSGSHHFHQGHIQKQCLKEGLLTTVLNGQTALFFVSIYTWYEYIHKYFLVCIIWTILCRCTFWMLLEGGDSSWTASWVAQIFNSCKTSLTPPWRRGNYLGNDTPKRLDLETSLVSLEIDLNTNKPTQGAIGLLRLNKSQRQSVEHGVFFLGHTRCHSETLDIFKLRWDTTQLLLP